MVGGLNSGLNFSIKVSETHPMGKSHNPAGRNPASPTGWPPRADDAHRDDRLRYSSVLGHRHMRPRAPSLLQPDRQAARILP